MYYAEDMHAAALVAAQAYADTVRHDSATNWSPINPAEFGANVAKAYKAAYDELREQPSNEAAVAGD